MKQKTCNLCSQEKALFGWRLAPRWMHTHHSGAGSFIVSGVSKVKGGASSLQPPDQGPYVFQHPSPNPGDTCLLAGLPLHTQELISGPTSQAVQVVKNLPANAGDARDVRSILGFGRSLAEGNGDPANGTLSSIPAWKPRRQRGLRATVSGVATHTCQKTH